MTGRFRRLRLSAAVAPDIFEGESGHFHRQTFVHRSPEGNLVENSNIDPWNRDSAAFATTHYRFAQNVRTIGSPI